MWAENNTTKPDLQETIKVKNQYEVENDKN